MERLNNFIDKQKEIIAEYDCGSDFEWEYEDYVDNMKYAPIKGEAFFIQGTNLDWRGSSRSAKAETLQEVANIILMHDGQCSTKVWKGTEPNTLEAVSYHHDCPTGSWFTIMTMYKAKRKRLI
jgi:hypothetical protein